MLAHGFLQSLRFLSLPLALLKKLGQAHALLLDHGFCLQLPSPLRLNRQCSQGSFFRLSLVALGHCFAYCRGPGTYLESQWPRAMGHFQ